MEETSTRPLIVKGYTIAPELFTMGYEEGGGPCRCSSICCEGGVYADVTERDRILAHRDMVARHMDSTQSRDAALWFDDAEEADPDFRSGRRIGTSVINDRCVFQNSQGLCTLQVAAAAEGMHRWAIKPLYCILYPIEVSDGTIGFDPMLQDEQACCTITSRYQVPVFEACRDELVVLLGEDGFEALRQHYQQRGPGSGPEGTP
jgi:Fe-S-cluster containining protein